MIELLPLGLRHALESGECVLFVGAGIGSHLKGLDGHAAPDSQKLAQQLAEAFSIKTDIYDLAQIAQIVTIRKGRPELETFLQKRLANLEPDETLKWLVSLRWKAIFTTNYDHGIERAYDLLQHPQQKPVPISATADMVSFDRVFEVPIYHLHGTLFGTPKPHIVITEEDYARFRERRRMLFELLKTELATSTFLYVGYSNRDPNWKLVLSELKTDFYPSNLPVSYRVTHDIDPLNIEILRSQNIETISVTIEEFVQNASVVLTETKIDPEKLKKIKYRVPPDFAVVFEKNPAAVARLLASWTYVNQAPFGETSNIASFLRGDKPNWGLIGRHHYFERDIEEQVYDELLDYATGVGKKPKVVILLGPAGYGTSTLLMGLAAKLVKDRAGTVFMQLPNTAFREGDVEYAISISSSSRSFFFIDSAADNISSLQSLVQRLKETGTSACFVLGERLNEWRQTGRALGGSEFVLEQLSDPEIHRLLHFLENNNALGVLRDLDEKLRFAAIKEIHKKELLVAMREATEGRQFDAILEDEYRGLGNDIARNLYLAVACCHQHGAFVRDTLLADVLAIALEDLYAKTASETEGVIIYEEWDGATGHYLARTRHRIIAEVIWERIGGLGEREKLLVSILGKLNFTYLPDRETFDRFIVSDRMVDSIRGLDGKIQFFELACKKDPDNAYVRQHYARMLLREHRSDLALAQIDSALILDSDARILHHTRGMALRDLAFSVESLDIARRRLAQSEAEFRRCISIYNRDEYSYQGLAQLYFGWAKRAPTNEEAASYISKAEESINEGLKAVRARESLWLVSSEIQKWLGDQPSHLQALEKAVAENPGSILARYLLGRAYRKRGRLDDAKQVLYKVISEHPDEFRACVEYARTLHQLGEPYSNSIAVLKLSTLYGLSDPRFVATLGGMLFMNGDFTEAKKVFAESSKREFPAIESQRVQFRPRDRDDLSKCLRLRGKVVVVKAGYAFIESHGYESFFCPGSKFGGLLMRQGIEVTFEPAFTARGAVADKPLPV